MSKHNLISAALSPAQKTEVLKCLSEAQNNLNFLINLTAAEKKRLPKMGFSSLGFAGECIRAFEEHPGLLPSDFDAEELKRDYALFEDLRVVSTKVRALQEGLQDTLAALSSDIMVACNDGYAALKRGGKRNNAVKMTTDLISRRYSKSGSRKEQIPDAATV